jgi:hypothetical protein
MIPYVECPEVKPRGAIFLKVKLIIAGTVSMGSLFANTV